MVKKFRSLLAASLIAAQPVSAGFSWSSVDFGVYSMGMPPPSFLYVPFRNDETGAITVSAVSSSSPVFWPATDCPGKTLAPGESCIVDVWFMPPASAGELGERTVLSGTVTVTHDGTTGPHLLGVTGTAERSPIAQYYIWILSFRAPTEAETAYWLGEARRALALGADAHDAWRVLAMTLMASPEFAATNYLGAAGRYEYVLYHALLARPTFFSDPAGTEYWASQLAAGVPRESIAASFVLSAEFTESLGRIVTPQNARPEVDFVMGLYAILGRVPEAQGFSYWLSRLRAAQCAGAAEVVGEMAAMAGLFIQSKEYAARGRTTGQLVSDLYYAVLRRGGEIAGVQFWSLELDSGARSPQRVAEDFVFSIEGTARARAIAAAGCR